MGQHYVSSRRQGKIYSGLAFTVPIALPMHETRDELRPHEPAGGRAKEVPLALLLAVLIVPCGPPTSEALLNETPHTDLLKVRNTLLALRLDLHLMQPLHLRLLTIAR